MRRISPKAAMLGMAACALSACATTPYAYPPPGASGPDLGGSAPLASRPRIDPDDAPVVLRNTPPMQCVPYARDASGIAIWGDAYTWWAQAEGRYERSSRPEMNAVLVLHSYAGPNRGHVAVVTAIISPREIRVDQANWLNSGEITLRVPVIDVSQENDWSQVRVWHIPTRAWGSRIYPAHGFILPRPARPSVYS